MKCYFTKVQRCPMVASFHLMVNTMIMYLYILLRTIFTPQCKIYSSMSSIIFALASLNCHSVGHRNMEHIVFIHVKYFVRLAMLKCSLKLFHHNIIIQFISINMFLFDSVHDFVNFMFGSLWSLKWPHFNLLKAPFYIFCHFMV